MAEPYVGEIRKVAFTFAPVGWALCNGQILSISNNEVLYTLIGTTYGGNGVTTFALPNLQGRAPVGPGSGMPIGSFGGEDVHTLTAAEMPGHTHLARASSSSATVRAANGSVWAATAQPGYGTGTGVAMAPEAIGPAGGGLPHENRPPFQVVNYIIALEGIFPSQG